MPYSIKNTCFLPAGIEIKFEIHPVVLPSSVHKRHLSAVKTANIL